jgi:polyhydroxyalkanoate synthesis regulator phasin
MSVEKSDDKSKVSDKAGEIAKNIWLAGVGAYGKAVDEAQGNLKEAQGNLKKAAAEPPKLFRDLVKAGSALEEEAQEARAAAKSSVEERINKVRENFHMQRLTRVEDLASLHQKVDTLTRKIDALTKAINKQGGPTARTATTRKKAATKGKTTTRKRKA